MPKIANNRREIQSVNGDGFFGDTFEAAIKSHFSQPALVSRGRSIDFVLNGKRHEIKSGAGELGRTGTKACSGVSVVRYCPVYVANKPLEAQEAFIIERNAFVNLIKEVGLYRTDKTPTNGRATVQAIQTFWNRSKNAPHGKKYYPLLDALYENQMMDWEEFLG